MSCPPERAVPRHVPQTVTLGVHHEHVGVDNAERAAATVDERTMQRMRGLIETTTGWHNTLLYWEEQDAAPALSADFRVLRG
jgi:hypothetical protein